MNTEIRQKEKLQVKTEIMIENIDGIIKSLSGRPTSEKEKEIREFYKNIQDKLSDHLDIYLD